MNHYEIFKHLHQQKEPLLIGNAWNAASARILERNDFKAIATSSAAIAYSLGYEDGENIPFSELLFVTERIAQCIHVPLSVDIETGYGKDPAEVVRNIEQLHNLGAVGINIEDTLIGPKREMAPVEAFAEKLHYIKSKLDGKGIQMFLNVRTDSYLVGLPTPLNETLKRISAYEQAGADGIFVPFIKNMDDIRDVVAATSLPVHVLCVANLPSFKELAELGVKRVSMGNFVYTSTYNHLETLLRDILREGSFDTIF